MTYSFVKENMSLEIMKRRVMWLTNIILPDIAEKIGEKTGNGGGWIIGMSNALRRKKNIDLVYCFCRSKKNEIVHGDINNLIYYGVPKRYDEPTKYDKNLEEHFANIIEKVKPEIVHIFGTEFPHTLSMVKAFNNPDRTIINIQGLCSIYAMHYFAGLPYEIIKHSTFRDFIRRDNLINQKKKFAVRGEYELHALKNVNHIIGRTSWDKACIMQVNPDVKYYICNEILRDNFYNHCWDYDRCIKYSIFVSQAGYPIKGLHFILEAMPEIIKKFPKTHLYIAGEDITMNNTLKEKVRLSSYAKFIIDLINKYSLSSKITFTGPLNEKQMCQQFLRSNVFVSPSVIENESNSVSEAKLLGVPVVASYVGGVVDRLTDKSDGYFYQYDAPYMLAHYICEIFQDEKVALKLSSKAREIALITHNKSNNINRLLEIYNQILEGKEQTC